MFLSFLLCSVNSHASNLLVAESLCSDGHSSRSLKVEDKDKEQKRETDGAKEKERYREKYMFKSIQELDLSNRERCTPSYRLLPEDVGFWVLYKWFVIDVINNFFNDV